MTFKTSTVVACWLIVAFVTAGFLIYAQHRTTTDDTMCNQEAPAGYKPDHKSVVESLKNVSDHSNDLSNWSILLIAGTIAMVVGTSYLRPAERTVRLAYLLFPPIWMILALSVLAGRDVRGSYLASTIVADRFLFGTIACANAVLARQIEFLFFAVIALGVWLIIFLHWWIFVPHEEKAK